MKSASSSRRTLLSVLVIVLVIAVIFTVFFLLERSENNRESAQLKTEAEQMNRTLWTDENTLLIDGDTFGFDHRLETFLFVGTDASGGQQMADDKMKRQPMADFILLMVLDHTRNTIGYLQLDRNTIVRIPMLDEEGKFSTYRNMQLCTAHWFGGTQEMAAENLVKTVRNYLGELENIDGYYIISMDDIQKLNNAVGGVDITLEEDLTDADPAFTKGATVHLTDEQAERYIRARMNVSDGTNASRMNRQRSYMTGLFSSVRQKCEKDPQFALSLWDTLHSAAFTNMNGNDFSRIAQKLIKGEDLGIRTVEGEVKIGYLLGDGEPHEEFYPSMDSLKAQLIDLFSLVAVDDEAEEEQPTEKPAEEKAVEKTEEKPEEKPDTKVEETADEDEDDDDDDEGVLVAPAVEGAPAIMGSDEPDDDDDDEGELIPDEPDDEDDEEDDDEDDGEPAVILVVEDAEPEKPASEKPKAEQGGDGQK